jgi:HEAT repeat protein
MRSDSHGVRWAAAEVMANDPAGYGVSAKIGAILKAVGDVSKLPKVTALYQDTAFTEAEVNYLHYTNALTAMKGGEGLLGSASSESQEERYVIAIARGRRGDAQARDDLVRVLQDTQADMFRAWAAYAMETIGSEKDLPLLRGMERKDPLKRPRVGCLQPPPGFPTVQYPVREAAARAVKAIEARR